MRIALFVFALVCVLGVLFFFPRSASVRNRVNVLVGTSPVGIWSWDTTDGSFDVILLPANVSADSVVYGRYTLEALWKLGFIDNKAGSVLARSLTDVLALSIPWFIGTGDALETTNDPVAYGRTVFSWRDAIPMVLGKKSTNVPLGTWFSFSWALSRARPDVIRVLDLVHQTPVGVETLPDQTVREFLDPERLDVVLKGRFEDEKIRQEGITVGVYNTTTTPALGTNAARMMTQEGVLVVAVGNSEPEIDGCVIEGNSKMLQSHTAGVVGELFACRQSQTDEQRREDIVVLLGR